MQIIAIPDIHAQAEALHDIAKPISDADMVLLPGDMTNGGPNGVEAMRKVLDVLASLNEHIYTVPGNMDTEAVLAMTSEMGINLHRQHVVLGDIALCGLGGALPFYGRFVFSEEVLAEYLEESVAGLPENMPMVLVSHQPPYGTVCDQLENGEHVGSHAVRAFIEQHQPLVVFCGHIHSGIGKDRIGESVILNPGRFTESRCYATATIEQGRLTDANIVRI